MQMHVQTFLLDYFIFIFLFPDDFNSELNRKSRLISSTAAIHEMKTNSQVEVK